MSAGFLLARQQDFIFSFFFFLAAGDVSAFSIRPDHATGLENIYSGHDCVDSPRDCDGLDAGRTVVDLSR